MVVSAGATTDPNGHALTFDWVELRGDPARVRIERGDVVGIRRRGMAEHFGIDAGAAFERMGQAFDDDRHLWPALFKLIAACRLSSRSPPGHKMHRPKASSKGSFERCWLA